MGFDECVDAARIGGHRGAIGGGHGALGVFGKMAEADPARLAVRFERNSSDHLGQFSRSQPAQAVHLPQAVLRGGVPLREERILERCGGDVRRAQAVAGDGYVMIHKCLDRPGGRGQRPVDIPVAGRDRRYQRQCNGGVDIFEEPIEVHIGIVLIMAESYYGLRIFLLFFILAANAFFAAAEVSLLTARNSRLRQLADEGDTGAKAALSLLASPEKLLASTQVGVTLATLGLGWAGEDTIYSLLLQSLQPLLTPATSVVLHGFSFVLAFLVMTYAHAVIGEVVPKNLGIEKADRLASPVALALLIFSRLSAPFVYIIERSSAAISRVIGLRGGAH